MKYIKDIEIFEKRTITREPRPIGDFIFDKFFPDNSRSRIYDQPPKAKGRITWDDYFVYIEFPYKSKKETLTLEDLNLFKDVISYFEKICPNKFKFNFYGIGKNSIEIELALEPQKVEEIKNTPEYKEWFKSVKDEYELFQSKKAAKKYNL